MKIGKEVKIGAVVVLALVLLFIGLNFLKGSIIFGNSRTFYGIYKKVNGLENSNPVVINGFKIGQVKNIEIIKGGRGRLMVTFVVNKDIDIPKDSKAILRSADLLGSMQIEVALGKSQTLAQDGDTLTPELEADLMEGVNEQLKPIKVKAESLISSVDSVIRVIEAVLGAESQQDLVQSFEGINKAISNLELTTFRIDTLVSDEKKRISAILSNIQKLSAILAQNGNKLGNIIANFSSISDTLAKADFAQTVVKANAALSEVEKIMTKIEKGEGSLGMLINNPDLYNKLESASNNLDLLVEDIRINPNRYVQFSVFGRKNKSIELTKSELEELKEYVKESEK